MTLKEIEAKYNTLTPDKSVSFIKDIHSVAVGGEVNTLLLIGFLGRVLDGFRLEGMRICFRNEKPSSLDRDKLTLFGKVAGAMMIILWQSNSFSELRDTTLTFLAYASAVVKNDYPFEVTLVDALCYQIVETGLDWRSLQEAQSLDILCYKLFNGIRFDKDASESFTYVGKGKVECGSGCLRVFSSDVVGSGRKAFSTVGDRVEIVSGDRREERLKSSDRDDIEALAGFADSFFQSQDSFKLSSVREREYVEEDKVDVILTGQTMDETSLLCEVVGARRPVSGMIVNEELIKGIWTRDLIPYVCGGDCIRGAEIVGMDEEGYLFSIKKAYSSYCKKLADNDFKKGLVMEAVVLDVKRNWYDGRVTWITPSGYGGVSLLPPDKDLRPGDMAVMTVLNIQTTSSSFFINLCPPKYGYDTVESPFPSPENVLSSFVTTRKDILAESGLKVDRKSQSQVGERLRMLASVLASRINGESGVESYRQGLASLFILRLIGDTESCDILDRRLFYLRRCLSFAQGNDVPKDGPHSLPEPQDTNIRLLSLWNGGYEEVLNIIASVPEDSPQRQIGSLVLGKILSSRHRDEIPADEESLRRSVCNILGVESAYVGKSYRRVGKYGKTEGQEVEFKSSYVFRNDDKGPDIDFQGKGQVFEAVCGFLNADGGTLYLGVKDNGDPILAEDSGLYADIRWLKANYKLLNGIRSRQLGHAVCEVKDLDSYIQFLNSEKELYFKESLQGNILIEVTEDADAIRISVAPSEYEIAYLYSDRTRSDGEAYVRDGGRTIMMSRVQKEHRLASLKRVGKEIGFVVIIQEAIERQGKLVFKGYSSGNSGEVQDRVVVPVSLFYNDENVYAYDLTSRRYKQFRLHRISSIEILPETYSLQKSTRIKADVFRWLDVGERAFHVKLRMDVGARNYLLEEYSMAGQLPESELYEEKRNKWILDTHVYGLGAVRRFYLGLADKIEILDTEDSDELRSDILAFVSKNIQYDG